MPLLSKASDVVQNIFFLYDVTGFTQIRHSIPVATSCTQGNTVADRKRCGGDPASGDRDTRLGAVIIYLYTEAVPFLPPPLSR